MNKPDLINLLRSKKTHERLKAARVLQEVATSDDRQSIRSALQEEEVSWIRKALNDVLQKIDSPDEYVAIVDERKDQELDLNDQTVKDIYSEAISESTRTILHEIEPQIGMLRLSARKEITNYESSRVKKDIDKLGNILGTISKLRLAASPPTIVYADLYELIQDCVSQIKQESSVPINVNKIAQLSVLTDKNLLTFIIINAIRNAIEATESLDGVQPPPVVISYGSNDKYYWLSVLDEGIGISSNARVYDIGSTTKKGHSGMGLAIARQAATSLKGSIELWPRKPNGARFEVKLPHYHTATE